MTLPTHSSARAATATWLLLVAATAASWWLVEDQAIAARVATTAALLIGAFKVRLVLRHFMELKSAPAAWRFFFDAWIALCVGAIVAGYWIALPCAACGG